VARGSELLYTYGPLRPADSLLFYGFAVRAEGALATDESGNSAARQAWRSELATQLGLPLEEGAAARALLASTLAEYDVALARVDALSLAEASPTAKDPRMADCRRVLHAERACLAC
jgi:hypothetical protein